MVEFLLKQKKGWIERILVGRVMFWYIVMLIVTNDFSNILTFKVTDTLYILIAINK